MLENDNKNIMKFINVPQSRTCRYESGVTPKNIQGLFTDTFTSCAILVLFNDKKISLTHVDDCCLEASDKLFNSLQAEVQWAGIDCNKLILYRPELGYNNMINTTNVLRKKGFQNLTFESVAVEDNECAISVDEDIFGMFKKSIEKLVEKKRSCSGIRLYNEKSVLPAVVRHPHEWQLLCTHVLYYGTNPDYYLNKYYNGQALFDGKSWSDFQFKAYQDMFKHYSKLIDKPSSIYEIYEKLTPKSKKQNHYDNMQNDKKAQIVLMSFYAQQLICNNNYNKIKELNCIEIKDQFFSENYNNYIKLYKFYDLFERQSKESNLPEDFKKTAESFLLINKSKGKNSLPRYLMGKILFFAFKDTICKHDAIDTILSKPIQECGFNFKIN